MFQSNSADRIKLLNSLIYLIASLAKKVVTPAYREDFLTVNIQFFLHPNPYLGYDFEEQVKKLNQVQKQKKLLEVFVSILLWNWYFNFNNHCKRPYKRSNGTTNLLDHLKRKHFTVLNGSNLRQQNEYDTNLPGTSGEQEQPQSASVLPHGNPVIAVSVTNNNVETLETGMRHKQLLLSNRFGTPSESQVSAFHEAIVKMVAENSGFRNMIQLLDSRYEIPSRRTLGRTIIPRIFSTVKNKVKTLLNQAKHVAITTDIWTSMNTDSYITMTVHVLFQTQLKTLVLCTKKLESSHTSVNLSEIMTEELNRWDIFEKVVAVVTDGGSNIKDAVRLMDLSHLPCIAHKLNFAVQNSLKLSDNQEIGPSDDIDESDLKELFKKCRNIVGYFRRSEVGNRMLVEKQKQLGCESVLKLKQDIRTRWNSTFLMLERLIKLKEPLTIVMISIREAPSNLSPDEWSIIEDIIPLLRPFDKLTTELSAEQYPTLSTILYH
ncbi:PREDICTED: zinc finger BED domain-containing protein 1-like [Diuraphis noxia]|uniref:zinc finger BED domain-containing protein 1-like n=1 Tax=Diuraphis noxia TaxID=143948 RepID=UPI00076380A3|nr:PREDICTED: zinc finger BED domain-containing protein 1-like [Diuraphis noxia]